MIIVPNMILNGASLTATVSLPEIRARWANDTLWQITVESVSGSPTTASIAAKFQQLNPVTANQIEDGDTTPVWTDLANANHAQLVPEDWPATLADQTLASEVTYSRRILGGFSHRVVLTLSFSAGSSPAFVVSANCIQRG